MVMIEFSMLAVILVLFLTQNTFTGANGNEQCDISAVEFCPKMKIEFTFPGSEEELNALCPEVATRFECIRNHDAMCPEQPNKIFTSEQHVKLQRLIGDACNNDSLLHKVLSQTLPCIKTTTFNNHDHCFELRHQLREAYTKYRGSSGESMEAESPTEIEHYECLIEITDASCILSMLSNKCGVMAKSVVLEVANRSKFLQARRCAKEFVPYLDSLLDNLELPTENKNELKELLISYVSVEDE